MQSHLQSAGLTKLSKRLRATASSERFFVEGCILVVDQSPVTCIDKRAKEGEGEREREGEISTPLSLSRAVSLSLSLALPLLPFFRQGCARELPPWPVRVGAPDRFGGEKSLHH